MAEHEDAELDDFDVDIDPALDRFQHVADLTDSVGNGISDFDQQLRSRVQIRTAEIQSSMGQFTAPIRQQLTARTDAIRATKNELDVSVLEAITGQLANLVERAGSDFPDLFLGAPPGPPIPIPGPGPTGCVSPGTTFKLGDLMPDWVAAIADLSAFPPGTQIRIISCSVCPDGSIAYTFSIDIPGGQSLAGGRNCPDPGPGPGPIPIPGPGPIPEPEPGPGPVPEPVPEPEPVPDEDEKCPDPIYVKICKDDDDDPVPVLWTHCETGVCMCLLEGEEPDGDGWEQDGDLSECFKAWYDCLTGQIIVKPGEDPPDEPDDEPPGPPTRLTFSGPRWQPVGEKTLLEICEECFDRTDDERNGNGRVHDAPLPEFNVARACEFLKPAIQMALGPHFSFAKLAAQAQHNAPREFVDNYLSTWILKFLPGGDATGWPLMPVFDIFFETIVEIVGSLFKKQGCEDPVQLSLRAAHTVLGFLNQYMGEGFRDLVIPIENQARFLCPVDIPSLAEADQAWLTKEIDTDVWKCWVRAKNQDEQNYAAVLRSKQSRLGPNELVQLLRREKIQRPEFNDRIRELGYIRGDEHQEFFELSKQIPPVSDLIRMMVRDAADEQAVLRNRFDEDFQNKWTGQLKEWGENQGISEEFAKFVWRAHWSLPAPGQLAVMFHRSQFLPDGDPRKVTLDEIRETLKQQDVAPRWVDAFINITFRLIPQRVLRRALRFGVATEEESFETFRQQGFDERNARIMTDLSIREAKAIALRTKWLPDYVEGRITQSEFERLLEQDGIDSRFFSDLDVRATILTIRKRRELCIKSLRVRFLDAEFDFDRAVAELESLDVAFVKATTLAKGWECERDAQSKQIAATTLCRWSEDRLITPPDFVIRLERLHYTRANAERIVEACRLRIDRKEVTAERRRQKEQETEERREGSIAERAAKATEKRMKTRARRERSLLRSASRLAAKFEIDMPDTLDTLKAIFNNWKNRVGVDPDDVLAAIDGASKDKLVENILGVEQIVDRVMQQQPIIDVPID